MITQLNNKTYFIHTNMHHHLVQIFDANLQITNGLVNPTRIDMDHKSSPDGSYDNGLGNLILGFNNPRGHSLGSHNIILGSDNIFNSHDCIISGTGNICNAAYSLCLSGHYNTLNQPYTIALGGFFNQMNYKNSHEIDNVGNIELDGNKNVQFDSHHHIAYSVELSKLGN